MNKDSKYEGERKDDGTPHGQGHLIWHDGESYKGEFKNIKFILNHNNSLLSIKFSIKKIVFKKILFFK